MCSIRLRTISLTALLVVAAVVPKVAAAEERDTAEPAEHAFAKNAAEITPRVAYTHEAFGSPSKSLGAIATGSLRQEGTGRPSPWLSGSFLAWGNPIERLTLMVEGGRRDNGELAPSAGGQVRILGSRRDHYALSVLTRYKAEGFAELGGEVEAGFLASYAKGRLHLDANVIAGAGFEEGEADAELLTRFGYDVLAPLRLGAEGRLRQRLAGTGDLPGGRTWDGFLGGQATLSAERALFAITAGPSTVGLSNGVGWASIVSIGGAAF